MVNISSLLYATFHRAWLLSTLQRGTSDQGAAEDWTFKAQAPYVHTRLHWRILGALLQYISYDSGTPSAGLLDPPESESRLWPCGEPPSYSSVSLYIPATGISV